MNAKAMTDEAEMRFGSVSNFIIKFRIEAIR
jgi:hypothetical protein